MSIILNEYDWAKEMITQSSLGDKPFETLCRVAKYYMKDGYKGKDLKILMNAFLTKCDPFASIPKWENTMDAAITRASRSPAVTIDEIIITDTEIDTIKGIKSKQAQRLAFTLLCLSKYFDAISTNPDHWVNAPDAEIMNMANINTSIKRQSLMYHGLNELGLIQFSRKVDNTNVRVCFAADGNVAMRIHDMRNLGNQYMLHIGASGYMMCSCCGLVTKYDTKTSGRKPKYCRDCASEMKLRQTIAAVMRRRTIAQ